MPEAALSNTSDTTSFHVTSTLDYAQTKLSLPRVAYPGDTPSSQRRHRVEAPKSSNRVLMQ